MGDTDGTDAIDDTTAITLWGQVNRGYQATHRRVNAAIKAAFDLNEAETAAQEVGAGLLMIGVIGGLMPAWMRKTVNSITEGDIDERQYNSMFGDSMRALVASGEYDPADTERLMEDAMEYARFKAEQFAASQGKTLDEVLDEAGFGGENNTDWFKGLDTQFNA